ncbi:MAG TPA: nicotinate (nicotinamide) nucleotide adenylyltransferase [Thermoanaerobaculia bacterium]
MNIGICGGTFDPFHRGHLDPILAVRGQMQWSRVVYIPAFRQPFKAGAVTSSGYHRFAMTVLGVEQQDGMTVSPRELERGAISYTVETLEAIRADEGDEVTIDWIIGDDNLAGLDRWKDPERILDLANFVVLTRGVGADVSERFRSHVVTEPSSRGRCGAIAFARNHTVPISSTEIRRRVRAGESIDEMVDVRVSRYIERNALYREVQT